MTDNEVAIIVVAIVFGSILGIVAIAKLAGLIKEWIKRNNSAYDEEKFNRLAKAFIQYRKETDQRLKKLEPDSGKQKIDTKPSKESMKELRLDDATQIKPDDDSTQTEKEDGNLRNMLRVKE